MALGKCFAVQARRVSSRRDVDPPRPVVWPSPPTISIGPPSWRPSRSDRVVRSEERYIPAMGCSGVRKAMAYERAGLSRAK
jgi:hypothetical protein